MWKTFILLCGKCTEDYTCKSLSELASFRRRRDKNILVFFFRFTVYYVQMIATAVIFIQHSTAWGGVWLEGQRPRGFLTRAYNTGSNWRGKWPGAFDCTSPSDNLSWTVCNRFVSSTLETKLRQIAVARISRWTTANSIVDAAILLPSISILIRWRRTVCLSVYRWRRQVCLLSQVIDGLIGDRLVADVKRCSSSSSSSSSTRERRSAMFAQRRTPSLEQTSTWLRSNRHTVRQRTERNVTYWRAWNSRRV